MGARHEAPGDDGSGACFHHLVGNVAEYVYEYPKALDGMHARTPAALRELLIGNPDAVRVIGASALSSPELWNGKDKPFDKAYPFGISGERGDLANAGYSDVGLRLAFTAPGEPLQESLSRLLDQKNWYLTGAAD